MTRGCGEAGLFQCFIPLTLFMKEPHVVQFILLYLHVVFEFSSRPHFRCSSCKLFFFFLEEEEDKSQLPVLQLYLGHRRLDSLNVDEMFPSTVRVPVKDELL